jgi:hydroxyethylthiazole kinase
MCHISPLRLRLAEEILQSGPAIIRANQSEAASFGQLSTDEVCVALTGETDRVSWRGQAVNVHNGHFYMSKVTAVGCAQGALMAALAARKNTPFVAALTALVWFGVAGEIAASRSEGPGSFAPAFIDALHSVSVDEIRSGARLS